MKTYQNAMQKLLPLVGSAVLSVSLLGCTQVNNEDVGTISGGVIGGLIGSQFGAGSGQVAAAAAGALVGAFIGNKIGETMDKVDRMQVGQALEKTPTGQSTSWTNPDNGNQYTVQPTKTYQTQQGSTTQACREYTTTAIIGGKKEEVYGKACRTDDGSWKVVS